ncbi:hypothetical protein Nepgr_031351 [Nepenthes gracilis]|uniref:Uncharacterized protein n=1 Tax=Nepenthes gracilis TaxID=150966 RepID=A0AAD3TGD4_NEPGR|nr:hypothetical protein Nepgr_031351 [Nepenthes gracilis]
MRDSYSVNGAVHIIRRIESIQVGSVHIIGASLREPLRKAYHKECRTNSLSPSRLTMVNTRAQASDPARDSANPDQDHAADVLVNGATGKVPPPYIQQLVEQMQANNRRSKRFVEKKNNNSQLLHGLIIPLLPPKKVARGRRSRQRGPEKLGTIGLGVLRVRPQLRPMERSGSTSPTESPERRNPRYSRAEDHPPPSPERASRDCRDPREAAVRPLLNPPRASGVEEFPQLQEIDKRHSCRSPSGPNLEPRVPE